MHHRTNPNVHEEYIETIWFLYFCPLSSSNSNDLPSTFPPTDIPLVIFNFFSLFFEGYLELLG